jgi:hypothetical protein
MATQDCKTPASVTVDKDSTGKQYCRPHGLAEALREPRSDITAIQDELSPAIMGCVGTCFACGSAIYWATIAGERTMLDYGKLQRDPRLGDALLNFVSGGGTLLAEGDDLDRAKRWIAQGRVGLHRLHASFCVGKRGPHGA